MSTSILQSVLTNDRKHLLYFGYPRSEPPSYVPEWRFIGDKEVGGTHCLAMTSSDSGSALYTLTRLIMQRDPICAGSHQFLLLISSSCFFVKSAS